MPEAETRPLPWPPAAIGRLDVQTLETWLWGAAAPGILLVLNRRRPARPQNLKAGSF